MHTALATSASTPMSTPASPPELAAVWAALEALADPEIPVVTLRELGILRAVRQDAQGALEVVITPTYSGCPAMGQIADDIAAVLHAQGWAGRVVTQLAPAWTTDWITDEAREKLRAYGIAPPSRCGSGLTAVASAQPLRFVPAALLKPDIVPCPHCGSAHTTPTSQFGSTACKALYKCLDCQEPFDYFKPY